MRSLQEHFRQENVLRAQKETAVVVSGEDDQDFERIKILNDAWNAKVAEAREIRLKKENEERELYILSRLDAKKERDDERRQRVDELVRKEKVCTESLFMCEKIRTNATESIHRRHPKHTFYRKIWMQPLNMPSPIRSTSILLSI